MSDDAFTRQSYFDILHILSFVLSKYETIYSHEDIGGQWSIIEWVNVSFATAFIENKVTYTLDDGGVDVLGMQSKG